MNARADVEERPSMNMTDEIKTFRGRTLEEVLPKIKAEFGPDAVIVRQRDGLTGGVGGFFQRQCIEVDAHAGEPEPDAEPEIHVRRFDAYDDAPAMPEPYEERAEPSAFVPDPVVPETDSSTAEGLTAPGIQEILRQATPFADHLVAASRPAPEPEPEPAPGPIQLAVASKQRPAGAEAIERALSEAGLDAGLARELVAETVSHALPFGSPRALKRHVRDALARRIPVARHAGPGGRSVAFVGPGGAGKTACAARLAAAYARGSDLPVVCLTVRPKDAGAELSALLEPLGVGVTAVESAEEARAHIAGALRHALVVVDTPAVSPASDGDVRALRADLDALGLDEVHLTLPATYSAAAAEELADRLAPLSPSRLVLTHIDETTRVGETVDYLIRSGRPASFVCDAQALSPADPAELAALVLS